MYNAALKILNIIENNGYNAYIVGGYPRDKYIGNISNDIDICTNAKTSDIEKLFDKVDLKYQNYGNAIVYMDQYKFQITTFRKEKYLKNRNDLEITFIDNLEEDLKRRDFTINTLCIDKNGNYIDLMDSIKDINNKTIKLIGNIDRLKDDPLRILRAIRFAGLLDFNLDNSLIEGINKYGYLIEYLSLNKQKEELNKMNEKSIKLVYQYNLDKYIEKD